MTKYGHSMVFPEVLGGHGGPECYVPTICLIKKLIVNKFTKNKYIYIFSIVI